MKFVVALSDWVGLRKRCIAHSDLTPDAYVTQKTVTGAIRSRKTCRTEHCRPVVGALVERDCLGATIGGGPTGQARDQTHKRRSQDQRAFWRCKHTGISRVDDPLSGGCSS